MAHFRVVGITNEVAILNDAAANPCPNRQVEVSLVIPPAPGDILTVARAIDITGQIDRYF